MKRTLLLILFFGFMAFLNPLSINGLMATAHGNGNSLRSDLKPKQNTVKKLDLGGGVSLEVLYIPPGDFKMGSTAAVNQKYLQDHKAIVPYHMHHQDRFQWLRSGYFLLADRYDHNDPQSAPDARFFL